MSAQPLAVRSARRVAAAELHAACVAGFADYLSGAFQVPLAQWRAFLARQGVDLALSRVARRGKPVQAFALVAPRPAIGRWRLAAMAVIPAARGSGAAQMLLDNLVERASAAGLAALELEVFAQNERALRLYRSRGFEPLHALHGYERAARALADAAPRVRRVGLERACEWLATGAPPDLPLQVLPDALRGLAQPLTAWQRGSAQLVFGRAADGALVVYSLVDRDARQAAARLLLQALLANHGERTIKVPALQRLDVGGQALIDAGFRTQPLHQLMMLKTLRR